MKVREIFGGIKRYAVYLVKWIVLGSLMGLVGGLVAAAFHYCVTWATQFRTGHMYIVWLLPVGGLLIAALHKLCRIKTDTNIIFMTIHERSNVSALMAPLIFVSTFITHLFGGSAGREGAAIQIGGTLGFQAGKLLKLDEKASRLIVMSGISAVFAAMFGAPLTAAFFSMEVYSIGIIHYSGLAPCISSAYVAVMVAKYLGAEKLSFTLAQVPGLTFGNIALIAFLAALCGLLSILFCVCLHGGHKGFKKLFPNKYLRIAVGGLVIAILTFIEGTGRYNGVGMDTIREALSGNARTWDFALKILFTALTLSCGFKGGEIIPSMFVGATFGCLFGNIFGFDPGFCAAIGMIALFCGMVNCPVSSAFMGLELFGGVGLYFFVIAAAVSYILSGDFGIYHEQSLVYSKTRPEYINIHTK